VESAVFDCLARPSFVDQAVGLVMGPIEAKIVNQRATAVACALEAPQEFEEQGGQTTEGLQRVIHSEAHLLCREIARQVVKEAH